MRLKRPPGHVGRQRSGLPSPPACRGPGEYAKGAQRGLCGGSDLACHIDGFIATAAHTLLVQPDAAAPVEGRPAEILAAVQTALEAALRLVRPGKSIAEVRRPLRGLELGLRSCASCGWRAGLRRRALNPPHALIETRSFVMRSCNRLQVDSSWGSVEPINWHMLSSKP